MSPTFCGLGGIHCPQLGELKTRAKIGSKIGWGIRQNCLTSPMAMLTPMAFPKNVHS